MTWVVAFGLSQQLWEFVLAPPTILAAGQSLRATPALESEVDARITSQQSVFPAFTDEK